MSTPLSADREELNRMNIDARIRNPKYLLTILIIASAYCLSYAFVSKKYFLYVVLGLVVLFVIAIALHLFRLMRRPLEYATGLDKLWLIIASTLGVIIGPILYYLVLRRKLPTISTIALKIGAKIAVIFIIYAAIVVGVVLHQSWTFNNYTKFRNDSAAIYNDMEGVFTGTKNLDATAVKDECTKLVSDTAILKALPAYPEELTRNLISDGVTALNNGATDCLAGMTKDDQKAAIRSTNEIVDGYRHLQIANHNINVRNNQ
jgi:hypothetical protein